METHVRQHLGELADLRAELAGPIRKRAPSSCRRTTNHDMRERIGAYRFDYLRHRFMPVSRETLDVADRDGPELVDALVFTVWELVRQDVGKTPCP